MGDHLLAAAVDHLAASNWMFASVNSEEGEQPDPPAPVPRPEYEEEEPADGTPAAPAPADGPAAAADDGAPSAVQLARFFA
ncbi:hypothetical protein [Streptomyces sp. NPDC088785]|uniref:hypothetical protein n=1 Tax=Streptomyces sp. NPDC088785 TaxID=3365897 RepID=UPI00381ED697